MIRVFAWLIKWVIYGGKLPAVCMWCEYANAAPASQRKEIEKVEE